MDLSVNLNQEPEIEDILKLFRKLSQETDYYQIIDVNDELLVSSDFIGNKHNAIIDSGSTMKIDNIYKFLVWYDNEMGYAKNIIRLIKYLKF